MPSEPLVVKWIAAAVAIVVTLLLATRSPAPSIRSSFPSAISLSG